jgi:hypothetical protein
LCISLLNVSKCDTHFSKIQKRILSKLFQSKFNDSFCDESLSIYWELIYPWRPSWLWSHVWLSGFQLPDFRSWNLDQGEVCNFMWQRLPVTCDRSVGFCQDPPVSSTNKTDRHDIAEILLKVALNTITQTKNDSFFECQFS